jgi:hypothetical protein
MKPARRRSSRVAPCLPAPGPDGHRLTVGKYLLRRRAVECRMEERFVKRKVGQNKIRLSMKVTPRYQLGVTSCGFRRPWLLGVAAPRALG